MSGAVDCWWDLADGPSHVRYALNVELQTLRWGSSKLDNHHSRCRAVDRWWDLAVGVSRVRYALNEESRSGHTLRGDEMGVEQARQPPLSSSSKVSGVVDRWWGIAVGSSRVRYALNVESRP